MLDNSEPAKCQGFPTHRLQVKLTRLLRVKEELRDECQPVPPELEEKIHEIYEALNQLDLKD